MIEKLMLKLYKKSNIAIDIHLKLDVFKNISVSVACRLGLANTFCCFLINSITLNRFFK